MPRARGHTPCRSSRFASGHSRAGGAIPSWEQRERWHSPLGLGCPVTAAEAPGHGWMSCDQRPGGPRREPHRWMSPHLRLLAGEGARGRLSPPRRPGAGGEVCCPRAPGSMALLRSYSTGCCPRHQKRALGHASVCSRGAPYAQSVHASGQRWAGSGSERPESGHRGALPCSPLRRQERGPRARTARAPCPH